MYAIILREVIFIVSVEIPTLILGPLELFLSELHTHSMLSVAIKLSLLVCNSSEKAELLIFCTEKYELKLDDMSYYILYTFQTPMFTLFCPTVKYVLLFYAETICLGILIILFKKYADALFTLLKVLCFYHSCGVFYMVLSLPCK